MINEYPCHLLYVLVQERKEGCLDWIGNASTRQKVIILNKTTGCQQLWIILVGIHEICRNMPDFIFRDWRETFIKSVFEKLLVSDKRGLRAKGTS